MRFRLLVYLVCWLIAFSCTSSKKDIAVEPVRSHIYREGYVIPELPDSMFFCGKLIHLADEDIHEKLDRELLVNTFFQSSTVQAIKRANRYFPIIEAILKKHGIPDDFKYLAVIESNLLQAVSPAGAQGFWQFMPTTAKEYDLLISNEVDERLNIEKSTEAACKYLKLAYNELGSWDLAAASYNRGIGGVRQDMNWQGTDNYFDTHMNSETGRYVYRILAVKLIFEDPEHYGYSIKKGELYEPFHTTSVEVKSSIGNLAEWALSKGINYKILVKLNPWLLSNKLTVKRQVFRLLLPHASMNLKPYEAYLK
jgi:membrane-bound lytic murein transglycosylase D